MTEQNVNYDLPPPFKKSRSDETFMEPLVKVKKEIYTVYFIIPSKDGQNNVRYKDISKSFSKEEICYKVNQILRNKYEERKVRSIRELAYYHESEDENSYRRSELKRIVENDFVPRTFEQIISFYKNNDALFYSNERLQHYYETIHDFFITVSYIRY